MASDDDKVMLKGIQDRFEVNIPTMPDTIDVSTYSKCFSIAICRWFMLVLMRLFPFT